MRAGQGHRELDLHEGRRGQFRTQANKVLPSYGAAVVVMAFDEVGQADTIAARSRSASAPIVS
jgi:cobalamin-dependent methionine synthase I